MCGDGAGSKSESQKAKGQGRANDHQVDPWWWGRSEVKLSVGPWVRVQITGAHGWAVQGWALGCWSPALLGCLPEQGLMAPEGWNRVLGCGQGGGSLRGTDRASKAYWCPLGPAITCLSMLETEINCLKNQKALKISCKGKKENLILD